jgi:antiviral helicase SLH1
MFVWINQSKPFHCQEGTTTSEGKSNILLQAYISREHVDDFALVSDTAYVAQNGGRIIRALLEIGISRKWANVTVVLISMSQAIEKRLWPFDNPLKQFSLKGEVLYGLETYASEFSIPELTSMSAAQLGELVHLNERHGAAILSSAKQFPTVKLTYELRPL